MAYRELLSTQVRRTIEFDPYWDSAFDLFPYRQLSATVSKDLLTDFTLGGGVDVRRLSESSDESQFNHDFERWSASVTWSHIGGEELTANVAVDSWRSDDDVLALTGDVTAEICTAFTAMLGTDYSLYEYDSFLQRERDHVRSVFARFIYRIDDAVRLRIDYSYEDDETERYHVLEADIRWTF
jgi:hypothetical protein